MTELQAGVTDGLDEATYHAQKDSLSVSGAKRLLPPSCPALFKWELDNGGRANKQAFDVGHAAHSEVLGAGAPLLVIDADDYRSKSAREQRDEAYDRGEVPVLVHEHLTVQAMAKALREHPIASALFDPAHGRPEVSLHWQDEEHGIKLRGRLDWLGEQRTPDGRLIVPDYKTTISADRESISKSVLNYGYAMQDDHYSEGVRATGLADDVAFVFVFQEKTAPYLVNVVELDPLAKQYGKAKNHLARRIYAECLRTGVWPGYSSDVELISLPKWATYGLEDAA